MREYGGLGGHNWLLLVSVWEEKFFSHFFLFVVGQFLDVVASLVLTCVSNRQVQSLTKIQAFSLAGACVRMPLPIGICPCAHPMCIDSSARYSSIRLRNYPIYCSEKARKYLKRKIKQFANCYFHKGNAGKCFLLWQHFMKVGRGILNVKSFSIGRVWHNSHFLHWILSHNSNWFLPFDRSELNEFRLGKSH